MIQYLLIILINTISDCYCSNNTNNNTNNTNNNTNNTNNNTNNNTHNTNNNTNKFLLIVGLISIGSFMMCMFLISYKSKKTIKNYDIQMNVME